MKALIITEKRTAGAEIASTLDDGYFQKLGLARLLEESKANGFLEGDNFILCWAAGHLYTQKRSGDIDEKWGLWRFLSGDDEYRMEDMASRMIMIPSTQKNKVRQQKLLKKLLKRKDISKIYNGCDADDEGQAIFEHIMMFLGGNARKLEVYRLWITGAFKSKVAIDKAFKACSKNSEPKYRYLFVTQVARSTCDYLLGSKLTKTAVDFWNDTYYIGRVKAIIVALIGNREKEVKMFVEKTFWGMVGGLGDLTLKHFYYSTEEGVDSKGVAKTVKKKETQYFKKDEVESAYSGISRDGFRVEITKLDTKRTTTKEVPLPLSGSDFSAEMMLKFPHLTYRDTETQLDFLRDGGWTSYPGTNGRYFAKDDEAEVQIAIETIKAFYGYPVVYDSSSPVINSKKAEKQNHPPLHVTEKVPTKEDLESWKRAPIGHLEDAYRLISMRLAANFLPDDEIEKQHLEVRSRSGVMFELRGQKVISPGWRAYLGTKEEDTTFNVGSMKIGDQITLSSVNLTEGKTKPAEPYTTKTLLSTMMNVSGEVDKYIRDEVDPVKIKSWKNIKRQLNSCEGLGTDRTRGNIMLELMENGIYEENQKKKLHLTEKGWNLYEILPVLLKSIVFSAQWEGLLEQIRQGKVSYKDFIAKIDGAIMNIMIPEMIGKVGKKVKPKPRREGSKSEAMGVPCPLCGSDIVQNEIGYKCITNKSTKKKHSGCRFFMFRGMDKTLGRTVSGKEDLKKILASSKKEPLKETAHAIYFNKTSKNFIDVIWQKKELVEKTGMEKVTDASKTMLVGKTWKQGARYFYKNFRGKDITAAEAEELFAGRKIIVTRTSKSKGDPYKLEVFMEKDGQLESNFANNDSTEEEK